MRSIFEVTGPNGGGLLTLAEAKAALGVTDNTRDADINALIAKTSAAIFRACNLREDGISPPTLLSEEMTDSFRLDSISNPLRLSRRRVTEISVMEGGVELDESQYEINRGAGILRRLSGSDYYHEWWPSGRVVVNYTAGFETVPADLKIAAELWLRTLWQSSYETPAAVVDTSLRVEDIPGVRRIERFNPTSTVTTSATLVPSEVQSILVSGNYVEIWFA